VRTIESHLQGLKPCWFGLCAGAGKRPPSEQSEADGPCTPCCERKSAEGSETNGDKHGSVQPASNKAERLRFGTGKKKGRAENPAYKVCVIWLGKMYQTVRL